MRTTGRTKARTCSQMWQLREEWGPRACPLLAEARRQVLQWQLGQPASAQTSPGQRLEAWGGAEMPLPACSGAAPAGTQTSSPMPGVIHRALGSFPGIGLLGQARGQRTGSRTEPASSAASLPSRGPSCFESPPCQGDGGSLKGMPSPLMTALSLRRGVKRGETNDRFSH